jgi:hypothetical protein
LSHNQKGHPPRRLADCLGTPQRSNATAGLLLPGAFLVAIGAELFAALVFVNFAFAAFF